MRVNCEAKKQGCKRGLLGVFTLETHVLVVLTRAGEGEWSRCELARVKPRGLTRACC